MNVPLGPPRTRLLVGSPEGGSTLMISAPSWERMCSAKGAASMVPSSTTRRPQRGGVACDACAGEGRCILREEHRLREYRMHSILSRGCRRQGCNACVARASRDRRVHRTDLQQSFLFLEASNCGL